jgi:hypothetical protein
MYYLRKVWVFRLWPLLQRLHPDPRASYWGFSSRVTQFITRPWRIWRDVNKIPVLCYPRPIRQSGVSVTCLSLIVVCWAGRISPIWRVVILIGRLVIWYSSCFAVQTLHLLAFILAGVVPGFISHLAGSCTFISLFMSTTWSLFVRLLIRWFRSLFLPVTLLHSRVSKMFCFYTSF